MGHDRESKQGPPESLNPLHNNSTNNNNTNNIDNNNNSTVYLIIPLIRFLDQIGIKWKFEIN